MLQKIKILLYTVFVALVLVLPNQVLARCNTQEACAAVAKSQGLKLGGAGYPFANSLGTKGCYSFNDGKYSGIAYFGTGGTTADEAVETLAPKYRIDTSGACNAQLHPSEVAPVMDVAAKNRAIQACKRLPPPLNELCEKRPDFSKVRPGKKDTSKKAY